MQPVWLCIHSSRQFEETFKNAQWRKVQQMQLMWFREKEERPNFSGKTCGRCKRGSYSMLEVEGTPRLSWLLSNTSFIWSYHLDLRIFGWTLKRAKNAWHLFPTKLKGIDFHIEFFDNKKFGKIFILPGYFSQWYDMILYFVPCIILFVCCPIESRRGFVWNWYKVDLEA